MNFFKNRPTKTKHCINPQSFDDKETWSLDVTIAQFVVPRLKRLIEFKLDKFVVSESDAEMTHAEKLLCKHMSEFFENNANCIYPTSSNTQNNTNNHRG